MKNYKNIIIFKSIFFIASICYSQQSVVITNNLLKPIPSDSQTSIVKNEKIRSGKFQRGIILTLGAGARVYETTFVLAPSVTADLHKHFNFTTGVDIHFKSKKKESFVRINLIPNYVLRIGENAKFQIGAGFTFRVAGPGFVPMLSAKFDYKIFHNNFLGAEIKAFITNIVDGYLKLPILLNYSVRF